MAASACQGDAASPPSIPPFASGCGELLLLEIPSVSSFPHRVIASLAVEFRCPGSAPMLRDQMGRPCDHQIIGRGTRRAGRSLPAWFAPVRAHPCPDDCSFRAPPGRSANNRTSKNGASRPSSDGTERPHRSFTPRLPSVQSVWGAFELLSELG